MWELTFETAVTSFSPKAFTRFDTTENTIRLTSEDLGPRELSDCLIDFHFVSLNETGVKKLQNRGALFLECGSINCNCPESVWTFQYCGPFASLSYGQIIDPKNFTLPTEIDKSWVIHTMNTKPGSSGAPIFNENGEVVAIHCCYYKPFGQKLGINFAVPLSSVLLYLDEKNSRIGFSSGLFSRQPNNARN